MKTYRSISTTIAQLIIVVIVIAAAISVAGWFMGLWPNYAKVEGLEIMSTLSKINATGSFKIVVKNIGETDQKIVKLQIGTTDIPLNEISVAGNATISTNYIVIKTGGIATLTNKIGYTLNVTPDQTVTITIITYDGKQFNGAVQISRT